MVQPVVPNQELPLIPSQKILGWPHLGHILPHELGYYYIFVHLLQYGGDLGWSIGWSYEFFSCLQDLVLAPNPDLLVYPQESSLLRYSRVTNLSGYDPFWYLTMFPGDGFPMLPPLMSTEVSDRASYSGSEVDSNIFFIQCSPCANNLNFIIIHWWSFTRFCKHYWNL